ncbi:hypothetical protein J7L67_02540 [bacterium]|nr:hypothetical protein [bacterium]
MLKKILFFGYILLFTIVYNTYAQEQANQVIAYYFLTNYRCASCHKIEDFTREALKENFSDALNSGKLSYQPTNIDKKENKHFIKDYQLFTKTVVLSLIKNGKEIDRKNLDKVWDYLGNKQKFKDYIKKETASFLEQLQSSS